MAPEIDARLWEHGKAPLPGCVAKEECTAAYIGALKVWGESLADKLDRVKAEWR